MHTGSPPECGIFDAGNQKADALALPDEAVSCRVAFRDQARKEIPRFMRRIERDFRRKGIVRGISRRKLQEQAGNHFR